MNRLSSLIAFALVCVQSHAVGDDDSQSALRIDPVLQEEGVDAWPEPSGDYSAYGFLNLDGNVLHLNGADWSGLRAAFASADSTRATVLHIGDSHVQAEIATCRTRHHLQQRFGSAGRGLVAPLRIAGTNAPSDYNIMSTSTFVSSRLMKMPWPTEMGFTGVAVRPVTGNFSFDLRSPQPFSRVRVHWVGAPVSVAGVDGVIALMHDNAVDGVTELSLDRSVSEARIRLSAAGETAVCGFELLDGDSGVAYHAIGNNGATFSSYTMLPAMGADVSRLSPDLIILSLGTNEAFGRVSTGLFTTQIDNLVSDLRRHNPDAALLLVTPQECCRRLRVRRGRRRRRVTTYSVNTNIARLRQAILDYGRDNGVAVYDWYEVAGGAGSSARWLKHKLMNTDRIHLTRSGYTLQGDLFYDALLPQLITSGQNARQH